MGVINHILQWINDGELVHSHEAQTSVPPDVDTMCVLFPNASCAHSITGGVRTAPVTINDRRESNGANLTAENTVLSKKNDGGIREKEAYAALSLVLAIRPRTAG